MPPVNSPGRPGKRAAVLAAARATFLSEGYARSSMDAVAAAAQVSKRTVYNHFPDKEALFVAVIEDTVRPVLAEFLAMLDRHLSDVEVDGLRGALVAFGRDWVDTTVRFPEHAALLRLVIAEATHVPAIVDVWRAAGAGPSHHALADRLEAFARAGMLDVSDSRLAARHLTALVLSPSQSGSFFGLVPLADAEVDRLVSEGVDAFLRVYG